MKYILCIVFFIIGVIMFIDGIHRSDEQMSMAFGIVYILDIYCLTFTILYCFITNAEQKVEKKVIKEAKEELKNIENHQENSSL